MAPNTGTANFTNTGANAAKAQPMSPVGGPRLRWVEANTAASTKAVRREKLDAATGANSAVVPPVVCITAVNAIPGSPNCERYVFGPSGDSE